MRTFDVTDYGAVADGLALNTSAFQAAADACHQAGGGVLRVPAGTFATGIFELFSNTTLVVERGGRVLGSPRLEDHGVAGASVGLLFARSAHNLTLTGEGVLDANAALFFQEGMLHGLNDRDFPDSWQVRHGRPYGTSSLVHGPLLPRSRPGNMLVFARCQNLRLEGLTITGSPYWTVHCGDCDDVAVENLRIDNDLSHPNNDGLHFSNCRHVIVRDCRLSCGDDCVAVTGFREAMGEYQIALAITGAVRTSEDIEVSNCDMVSRSAGVRIGYGANPVRNVRLRGLNIHDSNRGIGIFARRADIEDISIENCRIHTSLVHGNWWGRGEPVHISAARSAESATLHQVRHVTLRDVDAEGENGIVVYAEEPGAVADVEMVRVRSRVRRGELFDAWGGNIDLRPVALPQRGIIAGGDAPLWAIGVRQLRCHDCCWERDPSATADFAAGPVIRDAL